MKKVSLILYILQGFVLIAYSQEKFSSVTIGKQVWMTENLNVDKFRNGDPIPWAKTEAEWQIANENNQPAWCYYKNSKKNQKQYGKLYNGYALIDERGLAPHGWHIPSCEEWDQLITYIGGVDSFPIKLVSKNGSSKFNGSDTYGFNARPSGLRWDGGSFDKLGISAYWWTKDEHFSSQNFWYYAIEEGRLIKDFHGADYGFSIRCLKD